MNRLGNPRFDDGLNPYVPIAAAATGIPPADVRFIRAGTLSIAYVFQLFLSILWTLALLAYVMALGWTPYDPNDAFVTWLWWQLYMVPVTIYVPWLMVYFLYQARKINWTAAIGTNQISLGLGQSLVRIIFVIYQIGLAVATAICAVTFVFFMIGRTDCAGYDACAGVDFSKTASASFIILLTTSGVMTIIGGISIVMSFFINSASRDVYVQNANAATASINFPGNIESEMMEMGVPKGKDPSVDEVLPKEAEDNGY